MDVLLGLLFVALVVSWIAVPILLARLLGRVDRLEREVAGLRVRERHAPVAVVRAPESDPWEDDEPVATPPPRVTPPEPQPVVLPRPRAAVSSTPDPPAVPAAPPVQERIEWERWLGVRGAGVLGGVFAALAAVLLFRHAIQEGWITPAMRVGGGIVAGLLLIGVGLRLHPRGYRYAPEALIGAGVVAQYAALWAGAELYDFWPLGVSFAAMALVTALTCVLSVRLRSTVVALLGLAGGFATPILLSTDEDRPLGLFGYLLFLNLGLLLVGRRLAIPWLGLVALAGTALLQHDWLERRFMAGDELFALTMLALFALVFAFQPRPTGDERRTSHTQLIGLLLPFLLGVHVVTRGSLDFELAPLAAFVGLLLAAGCFLARQKGLEALCIYASVGTLFLLTSWRFARGDDPDQALGLAVAAPLLTLVPLIAWFLAVKHARQAVESEADFAPSALSIDMLRGAATTMLLGSALLIFMLAFVSGAAAFLAVVLGLGALALIALVRARFDDDTSSAAVAIIAVIAGLGVASQAGLAQVTTVSSATTAAFGIIGLALLFLGGAFWLQRAGRSSARFAWIAASLYPFFPLFLHTQIDALGSELAPARLITVGLSSLAALVASLRSGKAVLFGLALGASTLALILPRGTLSLHTQPWVWVGFGLLLGALYSLAPRTRREPSRALLWMSGASPLLFSLALAPAVRGLGESAREPWLPALFALLAVLSTVLLSRRVPAALASHGLFAVVLIALATTRLVWIQPNMMFLGFTAAGLAAIWWRTSSTTVKVVGTAAAVGALLTTVFHALNTGHYARTGVVFLNELAFAHAAALVGPSLFASLLARRELATLQPWERRTSGELPWAALITGISAAGILFVWLTMTVMDAWSTGERVMLPRPRQSSFDLTLSLAWAAYGLALLALGLWRRAPGPRWASLFVLLITIGKVFLRDLGDLEGLARVGSLAGLALSLTLVSLLYQRFVFGRERQAAAP